VREKGLHVPPELEVSAADLAATVRPLRRCEPDDVVEDLASAIPSCGVGDSFGDHGSTLIRRETSAGNAPLRPDAGVDRRFYWETVRVYAKLYCVGSTRLESSAHRPGQLPPQFVEEVRDEHDTTRVVVR
jgi:hypothetical protein